MRSPIPAPRGRPPLGMTWDPFQGAYVPKESLGKTEKVTSTSAVRKSPPATPTPSRSYPPPTPTKSPAKSTKKTAKTVTSSSPVRPAETPAKSK